MSSVLLALSTDNLATLRDYGSGEWAAWMNDTFALDRVCGRTSQDSYGRMAGSWGNEGYANE